MTDSFGRNIDYLRISITDRCDLRCIYCMPPCGVESIPHSGILTLEETARTARIMAGLGISKIRLTGGEPLIRKNISALVSMLRETEGIEEICMTTNGVSLADYAQPLKDAGLDRVNISLDTLDRDIYRQITGYDRLGDVLSGTDAAYSAGLSPRINCVPLRGINENELHRIAQLAERPTDVRFIELMPVGCAKAHQGIPSDEVLDRLERYLGKAEREDDSDVSSPAMYYRFKGLTGRIGLISPLSHKFCRSCSRARLTANGFLKLCLQFPAGTDLRSPLRSGCTDEEIAHIITEAVMRKPYEHSFTDGEDTDTRKMVQIGG